MNLKAIELISAPALPPALTKSVILYSAHRRGLALLAKLPHLQRVELSGLPNVTLAGTKVFPASVQVSWDV